MDINLNDKAIFSSTKQATPMEGKVVTIVGLDMLSSISAGEPVYVIEFEPVEFEGQEHSDSLALEDELTLITPVTYAVEEPEVVVFQKGDRIAFKDDTRTVVTVTGEHGGFFNDFIRVQFDDGEFGLAHPDEFVLVSRASSEPFTKGDLVRFSGEPAESTKLRITGARGKVMTNLWEVEILDGPYAGMLGLNSAEELSLVQPVSV